MFSRFSFFFCVGCGFYGVFLQCLVVCWDLRGEVHCRRETVKNKCLVYIIRRLSFAGFFGILGLIGKWLLGIYVWRMFIKNKICCAYLETKNSWIVNNNNYRMADSFIRKVFRQVRSPFRHQFIQISQEDLVYAHRINFEFGSPSFFGFPF